MTKFSIVIPVYNVAAYLPECLDCILNQRFRDIEVIAVDDGSRDESAQILDEYAAKDSRLKVIHQLNAGVSAARNAGLDAATGEYISFVDGDDKVIDTMYEDLAAQTERFSDTDIFVFGFNNLCGSEVRVNQGFKDMLEAFIRKGCTKREFLLQLGGSVWTKIFKRSFIEEHHIRFAKGVPLAEDGLFCTECAMCEPVINVIGKSYYLYRIFRKESTMASQYGLDKELLCRDYMVRQPYYVQASREDRLVMDMKICANLLFRYSLLTYENRLKNIGYVQDYLAYLESEYSEKELKGEHNYFNLQGQIKAKGKEEVTFWQKLFSIKNTRDKMGKELRVLGMCFVLRRKSI